jgi:hypothetical protein
LIFAVFFPHLLLLRRLLSLGFHCVSLLSIESVDTLGRISRN